MNNARRRFLSIGTAASVALLSPGRGMASRERTSSLHLLQAGTPIDEMFGAGAARALAGNGPAVLARMQLHDLSAQRMSSFVQALALARGRCLIGVLAESDHVLFIEAVREVGGAVLCEGVHSVIRGIAESRHHFISLPSSQGIGTVVARALEKDGKPASVSEQAMHVPSDAVRASQLVTQPEGWPAIVGHALALVAEGLWVPDRVEPSSSATSLRLQARAAVRYISFAVQA